MVRWLKIRTILKNGCVDFKYWAERNTFKKIVRNIQILNKHEFSFLASFPPCQNFWWIFWDIETRGIWLKLFFTINTIHLDF